MVDVFFCQRTLPDVPYTGFLRCAAVVGLFVGAVNSVQSSKYPV